MAATGGTIGLHQRYRTMMVHAMDITYLYQVFSRVHSSLPQSGLSAYKM